MTDSAHPILTHGALSLTLAPALGGGIARFDYRSADGTTVPVLRSIDPSETTSVLDLGCFPLVPYVNRIRGGRFAFRGRDIVQAPNMAGDPSPLHGQGWLGRWTVDSLLGNEASLSFRHEAGEWPWTYDAAQHFLLDDLGLTASLSCTNASDEPMPCGLGFHPYFPCDEGTVLDTGVTCAWTVDEKVLPVDLVPAEGRFDLRERRICGQGLDNGFGGWNRHARMTSPELPFRIEMSSPDADFFQVYSPASGGLFVAEPVTHANAALNAAEEAWAELGLRVLQPGERMSLTMRLRVEPVQ